MLSLSTAFISSSPVSGRNLLKALEKYNIRGIELDCRINQTQFQQIQTHVRSSGLQVVSLHNFCPFPAVIPGRPPGGDYFMLSATDPEERRLAVQWTTKTIENANHLEAGVVVLHCGAVEMDSRHLDLYRMLRNDQGTSRSFRELLAVELEKREQLKSSYLDALLFSLDRLLEVAARQGVALGLENRNHYFELPAKAEMQLIVKEFNGAPLGYWHDTGHAHIHELLGIVSQREMLETFAQNLIGLHLHDARGLDDHRVPGTGDIDFSLLGPYLEEGRPLVIELAPGTSPDDVESGIAHVRALGDFKEATGNHEFFP